MVQIVSILSLKYFYGREILLFKFFMGVSLVSRLMFISCLPPVPDNLGVSVVDLRKRVAEKVGVAQNFARET